MRRRGHHPDRRSGARAAHRAREGGAVALNPRRTTDGLTNTGWTASGLAARIGVGLTGRPRWATAYAAAHAAGRAQRGPRPGRDTVFERVYHRRLGHVAPADRKALEVARAAVGDDTDVIERAVASGAPITSVAALAREWDGLPASHRVAMRRATAAQVGPLRWGTVPAQQVDGTTCGAAVMAVMTMQGDPLLARWLMSGAATGGYYPPEARRVRARFPEARTIAGRWHALQRVLHEQVTRRGLVGAPWPREFGTPPWRLDDELRFAGLRLRGLVLDDADAEAMHAARAHVASALRDGIPVPLYTGGDSSGGLAAAVPRHVVLIVGAEHDAWRVYEPSSGRVLEVAAARLHGGGEPHAAFGHWSRACWLIVPRRRGG